MWHRRVPAVCSTFRRKEYQPMKAIKMILFAGAAVAAAGVAIAQPVGPSAPRAEMTRDQVAANADQRFQRLDANRDGRVTTDELREQAEQRRATMQQRRTERQGQAFDRLDTNRDGQISREEFGQRMAMRGQGERPGMRGIRGQGQRHGMRGERGQAGPGGRMGMAMLGPDGAITAQEFRDRALQRFDRMDVNRDGRIGPDERRGRRGGPGGRASPPPQPQN